MKTGSPIQRMLAVMLSIKENSGEERMLLGKNFDDIDAQTIESLIYAGSESIHLEFKRETYGKSDKDKKELLKDVSAFANALGGHLIIGINEENGIASNFYPLKKTDVDSELRRLETIIRVGVEPKIIGLRIKSVEVTDGSIILIHVPKSFNPPHRVISGNSNRFHIRNSAGVHEISLEELRMLFGEQRSIEERARAFVGERFLRIQAGDGIIPIAVSDGALVMHLVPLPDFGARQRIEILVLKKQWTFFKTIIDQNSDTSVNLDGCCFSSKSDDDYHEYTHVFRDGSLEAISTKAFPNMKVLGGPNGLPKKLTYTISRYMKGLRMVEASPPILLQISAMNIKNIEMKYDAFSSSDPSYNRDILHLPSSLITEYRDNYDYTNVMAEQLNFLWNAFGIEKCPYFDSLESS